MKEYAVNSESENVSRVIREQIRHPENVRRLRALPAFAVKDETIPARLRILLARLEMTEHGMLGRSLAARPKYPL
jgi:hypothetical protein